MANEAVCIETPTNFARYTIADATAVPIGSIMKLSDPNTCALSSAGDVFAGIAWEEKTLSDGITEITCALNGVWDIKDAGAGITCGGMVSLNGANIVKQAVEAETVTGAVLGKALETAGAAEVIRVRVGGCV